jgi:uncharacterized protein (DUF433 family)
VNTPILDRITQPPSPDQAATIRDTGITVSEVVKALMGGKTADEVATEYSHLEAEDMIQALTYAIDDLFNEVHVLLFDLRNPINSLHVFCKYIAEDESVVLDQQLRDTASNIARGGEFASEHLISTIRRVRSNYFRLPE